MFFFSNLIFIRVNLLPKTTDVYILIVRVQEYNLLWISKPSRGEKGIRHEGQQERTKIWTNCKPGPEYS